MINDSHTILKRYPKYALYACVHAFHLHADTFWMLWNQCLFSATPRDQGVLHCKPDLLSHLFPMHWFSLNINGIFWIAFVFDFVCTLIRLSGQRWIPNSLHHRRFPNQILIVAGLTPCCFRNLFCNQLLWTYRDYVSLISQDSYFLNISSLFIFLMILLCGVFSFRCIQTGSLMESALPMSLTAGVKVGSLMGQVSNLVRLHS